MNYLPHCNATYISPFNLLKTCESSDNAPGESSNTVETFMQAAGGIAGTRRSGNYAC